jgi:hypothetical protein
VDAVEFQQVLVVSRLASDEGAAAFRRVVLLARRLSQSFGVRGAMLFDGETSVHLLEGAPPAVDAFISAVHGADSALGMHVLANRCNQPPLLLPRWCVGYLEPMVLDGWREVPAGPVEASTAIAHFMAMLAMVDCV